MSEKQPVVKDSPTGSATPSDNASLNSKKGSSSKDPVKNGVSPELPPLAARDNQRMESALGDAVLKLLRIREKGPKNDGYDLDAVSMNPRDKFFSS